MLKSIISLYQNNIKHPLNKNKLAFLQRVLHWQLNQWISPYPVVYPFLGSTKLIIQKGVHGITGNVYNGLADFQEMSLLLHLLRKGDLFLDIGANRGTYSILASGCKQALSYSFEPIKETFEQMLLNIKINNLEEYIKPHNFALGEKEDVASFINNQDAMNKIVASNLNLYDESKLEKVCIKSLDDFLEQENPILIKIDVEGHEGSVLNGAKKLLNNTSLKAIIIEANASISDFLKDYDFQEFNYDPFQRKLTSNNEINTWGNLIFIRDQEFVQKRLREAEKIKIFNFEY